MDRKVLIGKEDFLFLHNDTNRVIDQITGKLPLTYDLISEWAKELAIRTNHSKLNNYQYYAILCPNKHCVYSEFLPDGIELSDKRIAPNLTRIFPETVIYPLPFFLNNKTSLIYHKTDTHWNALGCAIFCNYLAPMIGSSKIEYEIVEETIIGDLGRKLSPQRSSTTNNILYERKARKIFDNNLVISGRVVIYETNKSFLPTAVIFGDSFFGNYLQVIAEFFSKMYFFWAPVYDKEIIDRIRPDVVLNESVERFVNRPYINSFINYSHLKIYRKDFTGRHQILTFNGASESFSGIDYEKAFKYAKQALAQSCASDYLFFRHRYIIMNDIDFIDEKYSRDIPAHVWRFSEKAKFSGWSFGFFCKDIYRLAGINVYLQNLSNLSGPITLSLSILEQNIESYVFEEQCVIYSKDYDIQALNVETDEQFVYFDLSNCEWRDSIQEVCYLFTIQNRTGIGAGYSYRGDMVEDYYLRGYFSLNNSNHFKCVGKNYSIAWHPVYKTNYPAR